MRIAIVIYRYSESKGGAERACANLVQGLVRAGHQVEIFAARGPADTTLPFHRVPSNTFLGIWKYTSFARNLRPLLQGFDIVQSFTRTLGCDVYRFGGGSHAEYMKRVGAARSWLGRLLSHLNPKNRAQLWLERCSFAPGAFRRIVAVSRRTRDEILAHYRIDERLIRVVPNGVDTARFRPENRRLGPAVRARFGLKDDDYVVLFCGNGFHIKGLNFAIEAMALVPREMKAKLLVVGRGPVSAYRRLARKHKLKDRVFFLGPRDNVHEFYAAADVLLHPSLHDPFPNVCLEAMATGIPVITTQVTGVAEIITNNIDSVVVEHGSDVYHLSEAIKALSNRDRREAMGAAARRTAERYTLDRYVNAYLEIYNEVLEEKRHAPGPTARAESRPPGGANRVP